jgi:hypothetical protein
LNRSLRAEYRIDRIDAASARRADSFRAQHLGEIDPSGAQCRPQAGRYGEHQD